MKPIFVMISMLFLAACASRPDEAAPNPAVTKADLKARDDFARNLPKPPER